MRLRMAARAVTRRGSAFPLWAATVKVVPRLKTRAVGDDLGLTQG